MVNKALALFLVGFSLLAGFSDRTQAETSLCLSWDANSVCPAYLAEVLPDSPELKQRLALARLQDRDWLNSSRMLLWPPAGSETPSVYSGFNTANQDGRLWYSFEVGAAWQQLYWFASQPYFYSDPNQGRGELLLGLGYHNQFLRDKVRSLTLGGVRLPTADAEIEARDSRQLLVAQKLFWELVPKQQLYLGIGYLQKGEDQRNYDPGDVTGVDLGFLAPLTDEDFQLQGGLLFVWQSSDTFRGAGLLTRENRIDLQAGLFLWQYLRLGLQWPLFTDSEYRQHADRQPLGEAGFHFRF